MQRISALNESSSSDDDQQNVQLTKTKEAKEAEAFAAYNKALSQQQKGNTHHAEKLLRNLFDHPLLKEAANLVNDENFDNQGLTQNHRGLQLLYSIHKNLASILLQRDHLQEAMADYIEAVKIDSTEVTVWFKMGQIARKLHNYPLAKICFQQALQCNPNHWPSLDSAITITFALGDYLMCLENISMALEKDCDYPKGLALRKQILQEQPSLESLTKELFLYCDPKIHTVTVDAEESKEYIDEALSIRSKQRQLALEDKEKEYRSLTFLNPLTPFTWKNVGEQLIALYDFATTSDPPKSLGLEVDLRDYFFLDQSVFLGGSATSNNTDSAADTSKRRLPPKLVNKTHEKEDNEKNSAFQRAKQQNGNNAFIPESLNIRDNAKESALLLRIQGHSVQTGTATTNSQDSEKAGSGEDRQQPSLEKDLISDENDLEAMDVSDTLAMPLLKDEDMDIAVLGLNDIRKTDWRPELLLKATDDELGLQDAKSLENVLSSVIDMEFAQDENVTIEKGDPEEAVSATDNLVSTTTSAKDRNQSGSDVEMKEEQTVTESTGHTSNLPTDTVTSKNLAAQTSDPITSKAVITCAVMSPETKLPVGVPTSLPNFQAPWTAEASQEALPTPRQDTDPAKSAPPPAHVSPVHKPRQMSTSPPPAHMSPCSTQSLTSLIQTHATQSPSISHIHPLPSPSSVPPPAILPSHQTQTSRSQTPLKAHISPPQTPKWDTALATKIPQPAHSATSQSLLQRTTSPSQTTTAQDTITNSPIGQASPVQLSQTHTTQAHVTHTQPLLLEPSPPHSVLTQSQKPHLPPPPYTSSQVQTPHTQPYQAHSSQRQSPQQVPISPTNISKSSSSALHSQPRAISPSQTPKLVQDAQPHNPASSVYSQPSTTTSVPLSRDTQISLTSVQQTHPPATHSQQTSVPDTAASTSPYHQTLISSQTQSLPALSLSISSPPSLSQQSMKPLSKISVLPSEHSPIATSLLSPNGSSSCPRSASVYHSVLSSLSQSEGELAPHKRPSVSQSTTQPPLLSPKRSKLEQQEDGVSSQRQDTMPRQSQPSTHTPDRRSTGDLIEDVVRSQLLSDSSHEKSRTSQAQKYSQSAQPSTSHPSSFHAPHHSPESTQSSTRLPPSQPGLVSSHSHPHSSIKASSHLLPSSSTPSLIPIRPGEAPTYLPLDYPSTGLEPYRERSGSLTLPSQHLNSLSVLEAEALLLASAGQQRPSFPRSRPPSLSRSSSLPGYYSHSADLPMPTYLSPPPLPPSPMSPFFLSGTKSPHNQRPLGLQPALPSVFSSSSFPSYPLLSHHHDISTLPYSGSLWSGLVPGLSSVHLPLTPTTTAASSSSRLPKHLESSLFLHGSSDRASIKQPTSERSPQEPKSSKSPSSATSSSLSYHHPHHHLSKSPPHSSPRHEQQQAFRTSQAAAAHLQSLALLAHQPAQSSDEALFQAVTGDHSYQKKGLLFQAMVETMLKSSVSSTRPSSSHATPTSTTARSHDHGSKAASSGSKRALGATKVSSASASGSKRGPKRKSDTPLQDDWANAYKRRSTRSRTGRNRKEEKNVDYQKLMKKYFPESLLYLEEDFDVEKNDENEMETDRNDEEPRNKLSSDVSAPKKLIDTEEEDVKNCVKKCLKGHGILDLIFKYLLHLAQKFDFVWYEGITEIYMKLYERLRKHLRIPTIFCGDDDGFTPEGLCNYATVILTWAELCLSRAVTENSFKSTISPSKAGQSDPGLLSCLGKFHTEDMLFLSSLTSRDDAFGATLNEFCVRLYWLKARQHQLLIETLDAVDCFEIVTELLEDMEKEKGLSKNSVKIYVPNTSQGSVISLSETSQQLESLHRCKSLEDTQKLYDDGHYAKVVDNLMSTFNKKQQNKNTKSMAQKERPSQLLLLLDSLYNTQRKTDCLQWGEVSLNEAILHYKRVPTIQLRQDWAATLVSIFGIIDKVMNEDETLLQSINRKHLIRLAHNLVSVIEISLDVAETVTEMPIGSVLPWKILYRVLKYEEQEIEKQKQRSTSPKPTNDEEDNDSDEEMSQSLSMLVESHDHLGRHSWCTKDDGHLLLFLSSVLEREMEGKDEEDIEEMKPTFEQCIYCLFGHPSKRGRARHLSEHNASHVTLTWERSGPIFYHFAPQSLPEFDGYRTSAVSPEVEILLRRINGLVPEKLSPGQHLSSVTDYIEGTVQSAPSVPAITITKTLDPYNICSALYYLLGDFYFKTKEQAKAVKFYQLDIVLNCNRLDSWAGLALAKMSQIEQKLNSTELKIEKPIHKNSESALRCFRRAVELEGGSRKLWLEYGSFAYQLHSHASRQIKHKDNFSISEDVLRIASERHKEMLVVAKTSYSRASECEGDGSEEDWLTYYMLGKVAEKQMENPDVYLEHYKQAAFCLHEEKAVYPKRIIFASTPPHLALEALEVFYRIHVCVLKLTVFRKAEEHLHILDKHVTEAMQSPFAKGEEKPQKAAEEEREEVFATAKPPVSAPTTSTRTKPVYHKNPLDHEYSRHKSSGDSQSESEDNRGQGQIEIGGHQSSGHSLQGNQSNKSQSTIDKVASNSDGNKDGEVMMGTEPSRENTHTHSVMDEQKADSSANTVKESDRLVSSNEIECQEISAADVDTTASHNIGADSEKLQEMEVEQRVDNAGLSDESDHTKVSDERGPEKSRIGEGKPAEKTDLNESEEKEKENCESEKELKDLVPSESDMDDIHPQVDENITDEIKSSQESKADGSVNLTEGFQSDSLAESSEEDAGMSCGNEGDIDTDAMDVDDDGDNKSVGTEDSQSLFSSQDSTVVNVSSPQSGQSSRAQGQGYEMMEVHAGQDEDSEVASISDSSAASCVRHGSEGFVPRSDFEDNDNDDEGNLGTSDADMDVDSGMNDKGIGGETSDQGAGSIKDNKTDSKDDDKDKIASNQRQETEKLTDSNIEVESTDNNGDRDKGVSDASKKETGSSQRHEPEVITDSNIKVESSDNKVDNDTIVAADNREKVVSSKSQDSDTPNNGNVKTEDFASGSHGNSSGQSGTETASEMEDTLRTEDRPEVSKESQTPKISEVERTERAQEKSPPAKGMDESGDAKQKDRGLDEDGKHLEYENEKWETEDKEKTSGTCERDEQVDRNTNKASGSENQERLSSNDQTLTETVPAASSNKDERDKVGGQIGPTTDGSGAEKESQAMEASSSSSVRAESDKQDPVLLREGIIAKCIAGLELCAARFYSHYKSLYWLARLYYISKKLDLARDILLGHPDWQDLPHMPAPGLFSERKQNNFFQGLWKIPVEDIDRSGCFATHVYRSVRLLLNVLTELGDLEMLKHLHSQLRRTPDTGKKFLRDAERFVLAEDAYLRCVMVVENDIQASDQWPDVQREENLLRTYRVWTAGKGCRHLSEATNALLKAFRIYMKGRTDVNRLTTHQAITFCQQNLSKALTPSTPSSSQPQSRLGSQSLSGSERSRSNQSAPVMSIEKAEAERSLSKEPEPTPQTPVPKEAPKVENTTTVKKSVDAAPSKTEEQEKVSAAPAQTTTTSSVTVTSTTSVTDSQKKQDGGDDEDGDVIVISDAE